MAHKKETPAEDWQERNRATRKRVALIFLSDNIELREFQQELLGACIAEIHGGFGILTCPLNLHYLANAKALMLDGATLMQIACTWG